MLVAPRFVLGRVHRVEVDTKSVVVARVLGLRHLAQAALSGVDPSPEVLAMGVWVDCAHAASAVGLAVVDHSRVRGGLTDALVAAAWAGFGYRDLTAAPVTAPSHDRVRDELARVVLEIAPGGSPLKSLASRRRA